MAIQFRSLFPLALPGMLALLGWWWFFSRKKERVSSNDPQTEAGGVALMAGPAIEDPLLKEEVCPGGTPMVSSVPQLPEKEQLSANKPSEEPPALPRTRTAPRRSESSGSLPNTSDARLQPGQGRDHSMKVELALIGDEAKSITLECPLQPPKDALFPHEAVEVCKQESALGRAPGRGWPGHGAAPGEKARETGRAEGTGDAVSGENVLEEDMLSQDCVSELEKSKAQSPAPLGGRGEERSSSPLQMGGRGEERSGSPLHMVKPAQKEEQVAGKALSSFAESGHPELAKDAETLVPPVRGSNGWDRELGREETWDKNKQIEQTAFQLISQVILEATEEVRATAVDRTVGQVHSASAMQPHTQEESYASASQKTVLGQDTTEPASATAGLATAPPEDLPPKTYVSCLSSPLSSPSKDEKPKNSAHHISLAPCPPPASPMEGSLDGASTVEGDTSTSVSCMSDHSQSVPSVASLEQCSDSVSTSGLEDSCTETSSSPRDKAISPPLPDSTEPFSNGVLKGELSDLGAEDGWTMDTDADHSGGSDGNSMDSVDGCCGLRKPDSLQNVQAGSNPKKVDLIIWEIEVPKHLVGRLIGKQGRYVSFLKQTSGAKIYISTLPYTQNIQICHIEGSQHHVDKALNLIGKKFKELNLTNIYAPPLPSLALPSLPMTSWLMLPDGVTVEVIVVSQVDAGHLFVQQHTHPTFHALRSLDQQMYLCYSQPGVPTLPTPVEITVICAAPGADGAWWRAQVVASYEETNEVEIRYVDYGGYKRVKVDVLRQIRSDFVTLPFQGAEVLLDSVMPLSDDDHFSPEADAAMREMTGNTALLAQVTSYSPTGLPLIQLWSVVGDEVVLINRSLVERGLAQWVDSCYASL